jgi:hypothetical protein
LNNFKKRPSGQQLILKFHFGLVVPGGCFY